MGGKAHRIVVLGGIHSAAATIGGSGDEVYDQQRQKNRHRQLSRALRFAFPCSEFRAGFWPPALAILLLPARCRQDFTPPAHCRQDFALHLPASPPSPQPFCRVGPACLTGHQTIAGLWSALLFGLGSHCGLWAVPCARLLDCFAQPPTPLALDGECQPSMSLLLGHTSARMIKMTVQR